MYKGALDNLDIQPRYMGREINRHIIYDRITVRQTLNYLGKLIDIYICIYFVISYLEQKLLTI